MPRHCGSHHADGVGVELEEVLADEGGLQEACQSKENYVHEHPACYCAHGPGGPLTVNAPPLSECLVPYISSTLARPLALLLQCLVGT